LPELSEKFRGPWAASPEGRAALGRVVSAPPAAITSTRADLVSIAAPTLVLWADRDRFFPVSLARDLAMSPARAEIFVIAQTGHLFPWKSPRRSPQPW
jgi:pimeloyl-ACP methyl ester carboxylesterase